MPSFRPAEENDAVERMQRRLVRPRTIPKKTAGKATCNPPGLSQKKIASSINKLGLHIPYYFHFRPFSSFLWGNGARWLAPPPIFSGQRTDN